MRISSTLRRAMSAIATNGVKPLATLDHPHANSPQAWRDLLAASNAAPNDFELIKTLVYKPKTAKTATPVPVVVVARDSTETSSSGIGKALNLKELRLASEDLLTEFFSLDKNSRESSYQDASPLIYDHPMQSPPLL